MQEVEQKFLSFILKNEGWVSKAIARISEECFSTSHGQWLYRTVCDHYLKFGTGISKSILRNYLSETFEGQELEEYLLYARAVAAQDATEKDFEFYADRLLNSKNYRDTLSALQEVAGSITPANATSKLDLLEERIAKIRASSPTAILSEIDVSKNFLTRIKNFDEIDGDVLGIPTPIKDLTDAIGGLRKTRLYVISAPAGDGKSNLLLQFGDFANTHSNNVVHVTLEMSYRDMEDRFHSLITGMDAKKIANRTLSPDEKKLFYHKLLRRHLHPDEHSALSAILKKSPVELGLAPTDEEIKIYGEMAKSKSMERFVGNFTSLRSRDNRFLIVDSPSGMSIPKLRSQLKSISSKFRIDLLVIDYLNLISSGVRGFQNWEEAAFVSRALKQLAREYNIPILTASQLHLGKQGDKLTQEDMRYSKAISENSDFVIAFRRSDKDKLMGIIRLELIKHRHSEDKVIPVREKFKNMAIENLIESSNER